MFRLRTVPSHDERSLALIEAFLLSDASGGVRPRPRDEIERAMETGLCLEISSEDGICGCSLIYKYDTWPSGAVFTEMGSMLVGTQGYGLQAFLAAFHLFQLYLEEYGDQLSEVFAVVAPESPSEHNLREKTRMLPAEPPASLQVIRAERGLPFAAGKLVLFADESCFERAFDDLKSWHESGRTFSTPKNGAHIHVDIEWFFPELLDEYRRERPS